MAVIRRRNDAQLSFADDGDHRLFLFVGRRRIATAIALIRGFARRGSDEIGNFWVDQTPAALYVLLALSLVGAIALAAMGAPQTLDHAARAMTLGGATQTIPLGPVASQESIKLLSGDGGGFFNANSAHPFENPTPANFDRL